MPRRDHIREEEKRLLSEVKKVYDAVGKLSIARSCQLRTDCCRFVLTGKTPYLTLGEALMALKAWRATGRARLPGSTDREGGCPFLDPQTNRCRIYDSRPFGCRTHFCDAAGGPYPRKDVIGFIRELEAIDQQLGGDGAHALPSAIQRAAEIFR